MTDKKFTDEEIIKALECCANGKCRECPLFKEDCGDDIICKNALDLITHLQEENETLKEFIVETRRCDKEIKSEARKEFAERLKCGVPQETGVIRCSDVDNLLNSWR